MKHTEALARLAESQAGVVHRRQLRGIGISREVEARHVARGLLIVEPGGVRRVAGAPTSWEQRMWIKVLGSRSAVAVGLRSAAHLHGLGRFPAHVEEIIDLDYLDRSHRNGSPRRSNRVPDHHLTHVRGLPVTTIPRTIFDLASQVSIKRYRRSLPSLHLRQVERALDDAIASGHPVSSFEKLLREHGGKGRGGTVVLRELLRDRGEGFVATESELEDLLVRVLVASRLPLPVRQRKVGGLDDRIGRVDFLFVAERVVIEVDGRRHHTALLDSEGDRWRDLELTAAGFTVIRVTHAQLVREPRRFIENLRALLHIRRAA